MKFAAISLSTLFCLVLNCLIGLGEGMSTIRKRFKEEEGRKEGEGGKGEEGREEG